MGMRKLKYHEQRLLRKTNFIEWENTNTKFEQSVCSKYYINNRNDYNKYSKITFMIQNICKKIITIPKELQSFYTQKLIKKLFSLGLINNKTLLDCKNINIISFCKRRLPVIVWRNKMVDNLKDAVRLVEQGHIRMGNKVISD